MVVGITGGVGSGKTFVVSVMKEYFHADILILDEIAHQLIMPNKKCYDALIQLFGTDIIMEDMQINRKKMADIIFHDTQILQAVNQIIHPAVKEYVIQEIEDIYHRTPDALIVIEAALLLQDRYDQICDEIWYVYAEDMVRRDWLAKNRHYSEEKITAMIEHQWPKEEYEKRCQKILFNIEECDSKKREEHMILQIEQAFSHKMFRRKYGRNE